MSLLPRQIRACVALALLLPGASAEEQLPPPPEVAGAIYLDPWQIEKEFIISPLALQQWVDLGIDAESELTPEIREEMKPSVAKFLARKCPVTVQDEEVAFTLDRIHFIEPDAAEFALIDPGSTVAPGDIRISVIYAAPNKDLRQALQVFWDLIPGNAPFVSVKVADAGGTRNFNLTSFNPSLNVRGRYRADARTAPLPPPPVDLLPAAVTKIPWLTILLLLFLFPLLVRVLRKNSNSARLIVALVLLATGAVLSRRHVTFDLRRQSSGNVVSKEESTLILDPLLRGIYHAFHYPDQSEQYDILQKVVGGKALTPVFLEVQRTLESRERDGARVRVSDLRIEDSQPSPLPGRPGFETACNWEVSGRVGHWGHFHDRTNLYRATFEIEPLEGVWKITGLTLHERERENRPDPPSEPAGTPADTPD